jgi:LacI family transcriptional regulator
MAPKPASRLKDVAEATGLSINTVSLALRGDPRVTEATMIVVKAAAKKLRYTPNTIARSLAERRTRTIAVVITDLMNPILTAAAKAIEAELSAHKYRTLIWSTNWSLESEIQACDLAKSRQVDGMFVFPVRHDNLRHLESLRRSGHPVVLLAGTTTLVDVITSDDKNGLRKAVRYLAEKGHRQIGMIDSLGGQYKPEKFEGYKAALEEAGLLFDPLLMVRANGISPANGWEAMQELMGRAKPTAIVGAADPLAIGAISWCRENGLHVPNDVAVVGFDNTAWSAFAAVPLSTVAYAAEAIAAQAVARMMELVAAPNRLPAPGLTIIDPELIVRSSA